MYALFTDETNNQPSKESKYFIYGGVILPLASVPKIHESIHAIRQDKKYPAGAVLKFSPNSRPETITKDIFGEIKRSLIIEGLNHEALFIAYMVPHPIAKGQGLSKTIEFGLNTILARFDQFLNEKNSHGLVFIDRPPMDNPHAYLSATFLEGLIFNNGRKPLSRICGLSITSDGTSHMHSLADIVIGSFRYCVNASMETPAVKKLLPPVMKMMWGREGSGTKHIGELGLVIRPKKMDQQHRQEVNTLITHLIQVANENKSGMT